MGIFLKGILGVLIMAHMKTCEDTREYYNRVFKRHTWSLDYSSDDFLS